MATLKDIASKLGISVSAVSMALKDHESISEETKRRVWGAQKELGYQPNLGRRSRARKPVAAANKVSDIAFVLIDYDFSDLLYARQFQAITRYCKRHHFRPIYVSAPSDELHRGELPYLLEHSDARGIIVSGRYDASVHRLLSQLDLPIIVSGNYMLGEEPWSACEIDIRQGVHLMTKRLHDLGHRNILLITKHPAGHFSHDIEAAYLQCTTGLGIPCRVLGETPGCFASDFETILRGPERPTALVLSTDGIGPMAMDVLEKVGLRIPKDLSIMAIHTGYHILRPPLAGISYDFDTIGEVTLRKLLELINNPNAPRTREIVPVLFEPGGSIAPPL